MATFSFKAGSLLHRPIEKFLNVCISENGLQIEWTKTDSEFTVRGNEEHINRVYLSLREWVKANKLD